MPSPYVKKLATKYGMTKSKAEKCWERAKAIVDDEYGADLAKSDSEKYYSLTTAIFKNIMKGEAKAKAKKSKGKAFKEFLREAYICITR